MHQSLKSARNLYISDYLGEAIETNPKRVWSFIKQKKHDHRFTDFKIIGSIISDGNCKAEILYEHFSSVFTNEDLSNIPNVENDLKSKINLRNLSIMNEVMKQLSSLKPYEACGPDAIPSWFLKRICN